VTRYTRTQSVCDLFHGTYPDTLLALQEKLRKPLSAITLLGSAYLGIGDPRNHWSSSLGYAGAFAGVQLLKGALKDEDAMCLYQVSAQHGEHATSQSHCVQSMSNNLRVMFGCSGPVPDLRQPLLRRSRCPCRRPRRP
jgi:hypothetical protein